MTMRFELFIKKAIKAVLPYGILVLYRHILVFYRLKKKQKLQQASLKASYYGDSPKSYCPICRKSGYFELFGYIPRPKAQCPHCGSLERHRLLWLFLQKHTDILSKTTKKILHVAAWPCFDKYFRKLFGKSYFTADLEDPNAMIKMDITDIQYPNETFDIIICCHVFEHIIDDIKAMSELCRVLKNNGWAVLLVPIADMEKTYEDYSIITEADRLKAFGQGDHVRLYGRDYIDRLKIAGFNVSIIGSKDIADEEDIKNMNLSVENIYYCKKGAGEKIRI